MVKETKERSSATHKLLTVLGIVLCIILIPVLVINVTLLIKGFTNENEVPSVGGIFPMIVLTDSMSGEFESGELIICKTIEAEDVKVKDVITYFDPEGNGTSVVTHRVLEITEIDGELAFVTKGDANNTQDKKPVTAKELIGIYTGIHIPSAGNVAIFMQTTPGLIVCVVLPLILLIGYDAIRRKMYNKKHSDDKEQLLAELEELRKLKESKTDSSEDNK